MYSVAIEYDLDPLQFWDMTLKEIEISIKAKQEKIKSNMMVSAIIAHNQSHHLASLIASMFDKKNKPLTMKQAYPGIFDGLPEIEERTRPKQQDWRVMQARMEQFAQAKKAWEVKKRGNDNRRTTSPDNSQDKRSTKRSPTRQKTDGKHSKGD